VQRTEFRGWSPLACAGRLSFVVVGFVDYYQMFRILNKNCALLHVHYQCCRALKTFRIVV
jgi:hypothetical protein